jgi:hypothetical protein
MEDFPFEYRPGAYVHKFMEVDVDRLEKIAPFLALLDMAKNFPEDFGIVKIEQRQWPGILPGDTVLGYHVVYWERVNGCERLPG